MPIAQLLKKTTRPFRHRGGGLAQVNKTFLRNPKNWIRGVRKIESQLQSENDAGLKSRTIELREQIADSAANYSMMTELCGLVSETVFRRQGIRMYDVQLQAMGAGVGRNIIEMQTGEGKTVVTGAIAAVKTFLQPAVHVGTTNPYLAARDLESMAETFDALGISHGLLPEENDESCSLLVYRSQIVYGPGYQYGFDYLRDQMELRKNRPNALGMATVNRIRGRDPYKDLIQTPDHHAALIDEADSVMIDEAMTPLVISLPMKQHEDPAPYLLAKKITAEFEEGVDYKIEMPAKRIEITDQAYARAHEAVSGEQLQLSRPWRVYISNAVRAVNLFNKNVDYVVVDEQVQIVDQYTGRIAPDRTWQDGLHQAIEAKEGVPIQPGRESTAQITRQRYLQMYSELAGLTGTASSVIAEFQSVYKCQVVDIPTHKKSQRKLLQARFFASLESKLAAIAAEVQTRHATGQPILIGTRTVQESLQVKDELESCGITPVVLNGVQDAEEADIVAAAGHWGAITIATNMAGRGTDIKLDKRGLEAGGLHVIGVSPNASQRIDRQLVGRSARQGQPGSAQFFAAATDELFVENLSPLHKAIARRANKKGEAGDFSRDLAKLQIDIEKRNFKSRQQMILRDCWMDTVREAIEKE